ncbi:MAG TPA: 3'-5' exonuclease [Acidobacteriaceae bacterium]|nr:3'-5' exonuclease [Acidobacteriaceae bacterium]
MDFLAIDVETACADQGSICQLGVAFFRARQCVRLESRLICPEMEFSWFNSALHGIGAEHVAQQPTWKEAYPELRSWVHANVLVSHTFFDRTAVERACRRYGTAMLPYAKWMDTCAAARQAWPQLANHKLPTLAEYFGIAYRAHDAAEDARVAGEIFLLAMQATGKTRVRK